MEYDYNDIVNRWFEELRHPFINYIRNNFRMSYDDINDLYSESWMELRKIIVSNRATDNKWRALLFKIGWRMADRKATCRPVMISIDQINNDEKDGEFNRGKFELENAVRKMDYKSVYEDPELQAVLGAELSYIPDPCSKILKMYYFDEFSMKEIADAMNYRSSDSAKTMKNRCLDKLKARVKDAVRLLGIID